MEGKVIEVVLDPVKWTKVMDGQWEIQPAQPKVCAIKNIDLESSIFYNFIGDQS